MHERIKQRRNAINSGRLSNRIIAHQKFILDLCQIAKEMVSELRGYYGERINETAAYNALDAMSGFSTEWRFIGDRNYDERFCYGAKQSYKLVLTVLRMYSAYINDVGRIDGYVTDGVIVTVNNLSDDIDNWLNEFGNAGNLGNR